ncbi:hypothetical protein PsorP6_012412 [Peronosclerospora sorghi]|uniref:Uncharacterized protein n=1 Tax=Peronosclerospora sorghi TaxID=230839 RepID=A0ACC0WEK1_9STRA|nr:hypothetical protein PsorP6_012412 [Peronosclerospora sorghi]
MGTFVEVPLPPGRKAVKYKWVFKKKTLADGSLDKYKARVVSKGFSKRYGEDYTETKVSVTVRVVLVVVVIRRMKRLQVDIKTAFLNSPLQEEIYMEPVEGYENNDGYASRSWYEKLRAYLISLGFQCRKDDNCLFIKGVDETLMIVLVYVDGILAFYMCDADLFDFKASMEATFELTTLMIFITFWWSCGGDEVRVSQHKSVCNEECTSRGNVHGRTVQRPSLPGADLTTFNPRPALGALLYLSVLTRPDISTAFRLRAQETERPTASLKAGIENVFRYLRSTKEHGLVIRDGAEHDGLVVYCNAAFASTGFAIFYDGNLVEWGSKKQGTVTLSSTEAEYIAMATGLQDCIGIMLVLKDLGIVAKNIVVMEDNQGAQHLAESKGALSVLVISTLSTIGYVRRYQMAWYVYNTVRPAK